MASPSCSLRYALTASHHGPAHWGEGAEGKDDGPLRGRMSLLRRLSTRGTRNQQRRARARRHTVAGWRRDLIPGPALEGQVGQGEHRPLRAHTRRNCVTGCLRAHGGSPARFPLVITPFPPGRRRVRHLSCSPIRFLRPRLAFPVRIRCRHQTPSRRASRIRSPIHAPSDRRQESPRRRVRRRCCGARHTEDVRGSRRCLAVRTRGN